MSFEIGPLQPVQGVARTQRTTPTPGFSLDLARTSEPAPVRDTAVLSLPASPPPEVLDAIGAAAERAAELRAANRELHFHKDKESGRVIVEVRDLDGNVIRTIPPSEALNVMSGAKV
jgi:flagellar protein FlaG